MIRLKSRRTLTVIVASAVLAAASVACSSAAPRPTATSAAPSGPRITVTEPWARPVMVVDASGNGAMDMDNGMDMSHSGSGITGAIYPTLVNAGDETDALTGVRDVFINSPGDLTDAAEIHRSIVQDGEMRMSPVVEVPIPAEGDSRLEPGG